MTQPVILIDLDGPLADFDRHYWTTAIGLYDEHPFDIVDLNERRYRFLSDHLTTSGKRTQMRVGQVNKAGWFADLPPVPGAVDAVLELAERAEVWICTKPLEPNPTCRDDKAAWIEHHLGAGWSRRLIITPDKSLVHGAVLLDDAIKPEWCSRATWTPVVYDEPFNRTGPHAGPHEAPWARFSWTDGIDALLDLAMKRAARPSPLDIGRVDCPVCGDEWRTWTPSSDPEVSTDGEPRCVWCDSAGSPTRQDPLVDFVAGDTHATAWVDPDDESFNTVGAHIDESTMRTSAAHWEVANGGDDGALDFARTGPFSHLHATRDWVRTEADPTRPWWVFHTQPSRDSQPATRLGWHPPYLPAGPDDDLHVWCDGHDGTRHTVPDAERDGDLCHDCWKLAATPVDCPDDPDDCGGCDRCASIDRAGLVPVVTITGRHYSDGSVRPLSLEAGA